MLIQNAERLPVLVKVEGGLGHVALDGKRLRGSQLRLSHACRAFSTRLQAAVGALAVPPDSGEMIQVLELIKTLPAE